MAQADHHQSKDRDDGPNAEQKVEVSRIQKRAGKDADEVADEELGRANPCDCRSRLVPEKIRLIDVLKLTMRVEQAKDVEHDHPGARNLYPGHKTPIWRCRGL
jgi:hypothetical protein